MKSTSIWTKPHAQRLTVACALASVVTLSLGTAAQARGVERGMLAQGPEVLVNATTAGDQFFPSVATNASGQCLVAWTDTSAGRSVVRGRLLDRTGAPVGEDLLVAGGADGARLFPAVTALDNGDFVVVHLVVVPGSLNQVWSQTVDRRARLAEAPVLLSEQATAVQFAPSVSALPGNRYVASWTGSDPTNPSDWDAKARVLRFDGRPVTGELRLNEVTVSRQSRPAVTPVRNGFVAAWTDGSLTKDTSVTGVVGRAFAVDGTPRTPDVLLNDITPGEQSRPSLTTLRSGRVAAAWEDREPARDGSGSAVVGRTFAADLGAPGTERVLNTTTAGNQQKPRVAATGDGGWLAAWEDGSSTDDPIFLGIRGRVLPADGEPVGGDRQLNTLTADNQQQPAVAVVRDRAVVVWTDESRALADKNRTSVVTRTYSLRAR